MPSALTLAGAGVGLLLGPWLAVTTVRLAERDPAARATPVRVVATSVLAAAVVAAGPVLAGDRPAAVALAWFGAAALVLADVDLRRHRLPDRVTWPALIGCGVALFADAVVVGEPGAVLAAGAGLAARVVSPAALGRGDVKLLGLLGVVLGWAGWGVLMGGVFAGLLVGALGSVLLITVGRAGWRTRVPFGPPLLVGAYVAMCLAAPLPLT